MVNGHSQREFNLAVMNMKTLYGNCCTCMCNIRGCGDLVMDCICNCCAIHCALLDKIEVVCCFQSELLFCPGVV